MATFRIARSCHPGGRFPPHPAPENPVPDSPPSSRDARFVGSIPQVYDEHLGPLLFAGYAADLAGRLALRTEAPSRVLELAAGTGILTREIVSRLPAGSTLVATDLNEPMLSVARGKLDRARPEVTVEWRTADATSLPFDDGEFDAVACQFGIMFFPDKPKAAREAFRALRPGGQWLFSVWGSFDENPFGRITHEAIAGFFEGDAPDFFRVPFGFADPRALRALAEDAGFSGVEVTAVDRTVQTPSAEHAATGLVKGTPGLLAIEERGGASPDEIVRAVADALAGEFGDAPLRMPARTHVVSAFRPD